MHDDAPAGDDDPSGHSAHTTDPLEHAYVPALQGVHFDPALEEYDPLAQGVHDDAPADDDDPFGHFLHLKVLDASA